MIILSGSITIAPGHADRVRAAVTELARQSQTEPGCADYHVTADIEHPGRFWVFEVWESDANLEAHRHSEHLAQFQRTLSQLPVQRVTMTEYAVGNIKRM